MKLRLYIDIITYITRRAIHITVRLKKNEVNIMVNLVYLDGFPLKNHPIVLLSSVMPLGLVSHIQIMLACSCGLTSMCRFSGIPMSIHKLNG